MRTRHAKCLDAAGVEDPELRAAFEQCRVLHAKFGRTYYLATLLLPPGKRPHVHSLYGFARFADEIVDNGDPRTKAADLGRWADRIVADLHRGASDDPICRALLHTIDTWDIPLDRFEAFLDSMLMDLTVTEYPTYTDLERYMYGSASVIGLQMVPILEPSGDEAYARAAKLGDAFQLSNFIRDVAEDLDRGRVYLPLEDLDRFGVTRADLERKVLTPPIRELLEFEIARTRALYAYAEPGIDMLAESSRDCIRTAFTLYGGILDEVERADYRIFDRRVGVGLGRRATVALKAYRHARSVRRAAAVAPR